MSDPQTVEAFFRASTDKATLKLCPRCTAERSHSAKVKYPSIPSWPLQVDNKFLARIASPDCPACRLVWTAAFKSGADFRKASNVVFMVTWEHGDLSSVSFPYLLSGVNPSGEAAPGGGIAERPHIHADPGANDYFSRILEQVEACDRQHDSCHPTDLPILPTRVIDVSQDRQPFLFEPSSGTRGKFVALSYCWGSAKFIKTTVATLQERKNGIDWNSLPKGFQDAILVAQKLGARYIWIDSLCILQDSPDDWQIEASKMASVYAGSYVTVAATGATGPDEGYLYPKVAPMQIGTVNLNGDSQVIFTRTRQLHYDWSHHGATTQPLLNRGWCFQERLLSIRVLHFTKQEWFFECWSETYCECTGRHKENNLRGAQSESSDLHDMLSQWHKDIVAYSGLSLTFETDRLPALSGLASRRASPATGRYLAGIWEAELPGGLFWERKIPLTTQRTSRYIAPSWSWASIIGRVSFDNSRVPFVHGKKSLTWLFDDYIIEVSTKTAGKNPFGEIETAILRVRVPIIVCSYSEGGGLMSNKALPAIPSAAFDTLEDAKQANGHEMILAGFRALPDERSNRPYRVLLLKHSSAVANGYERVGILKWSYSEATGVLVNLFEGIAPEEITIV